MAQANPQSQQTLELPAGTHWICTCGQSKKLPYCDGSHQGTDFRPIALELAAPVRWISPAPSMPKLHPNCLY